MAFVGEIGKREPCGTLTAPTSSVLYCTPMSWHTHNASARPETDQSCAWSPNARLRARCENGCWTFFVLELSKSPFVPGTGHRWPCWNEAFWRHCKPTQYEVKYFIKPCAFSCLKKKKKEKKKEKQSLCFHLRHDNVRNNILKEF